MQEQWQERMAWGEQNARQWGCFIAEPQQKGRNEYLIGEGMSVRRSVRKEKEARSKLEGTKKELANSSAERRVGEPHWEQ